MNERKLRVGMVGAGSWARQHLQAWTADEYTEVTAIWNRTKERAEKLAEEFDIRNVETDVDSVIRHDDIDIISISMPHNIHYPLVTAAIEAGKHVFCENGSKGEIRYDLITGVLLGKVDGSKEFNEIQIPDMKNTPTMVTQFVKNILDDSDLPPTFLDGLKAQEVMEAAIISAEKMKWVSL